MDIIWNKEEESIIIEKTVIAQKVRSINLMVCILQADETVVQVYANVTLERTNWPDVDVQDFPDLANVDEKTDKIDCLKNDCV